MKRASVVRPTCKSLGNLPVEWVVIDAIYFLLSTRMCLGFVSAVPSLTIRGKRKVGSMTCHKPSRWMGEGKIMGVRIVGRLYHRSANIEPANVIAGQGKVERLVASELDSASTGHL